MPLIKNFQSTTIWKAFLLNAIATTVIVLAALIIKDHLQRYVDVFGREVTGTQNIRELAITLGVTFASAIITYTFLYYIFGFGQGMLAC